MRGVVYHNSLFVKDLNSAFSKEIPLIFIVDYKKENYEIHYLSNLPNDICFEKFSNPKREYEHLYNLQIEPIDFSSYKSRFSNVLSEIERGNSYLLNLTAPSKIKTHLSLFEIYKSARSLFKIYFRDRFLSFTPERFVDIYDDKIYTYPMKGTISGEIEDAPKKLLQSQKELCEHTMVVDLLRNDLGSIGKKIRVESFREISKIDIANKKSIFQTSSKISANLEKNWHKRAGEIFDTILPAGSISGTPKKSSCEIIERVEGYDRGYFSGVVGVFDGKNLESFVLIRFIQKDRDLLTYKSGGGITALSKVEDEYNELIEKIYIP